MSINYYKTIKNLRFCGETFARYFELVWEICQVGERFADAEV